MNKSDIEEWIAHPNHALHRMPIPKFKALCELALRNVRAGFSVPQGEPVAVVYVADPIPEGTHGRWMSWLVNPVNLPNNMKLYAATPADGVPRAGVLVPEGELAALRAENERLDAANVGLAQESHNLQFDLTEQCRLNGMGQEREARLMAQLQEAERKLAELMKEGGE
jgi:hypothetical protein